MKWEWELVVPLISALGSIATIWVVRAMRKRNMHEIEQLVRKKVRQALKHH